MLLVDVVDLIVSFVGLLHLDKFWILGDWKVEKLLSQYIFLSGLVESLDLFLGLIQDINTLFKSNSRGSWTFTDIDFIFILDLLLEGLNLTFSDLRERLLKVINNEILLVSILNKIIPVGHQHSLFFISLLINFVLVHLQDSELFLDLKNSEFHIHRLVLDLVDDLKEGSKHLNGIHVGVQGLVVVDGLSHYLL